MNLKTIREQVARLAALTAQADDAAQALATKQTGTETLLRTLNPNDAEAGQQLQQARADADLAGLRQSRLKDEIKALRQQLTAAYSRAADGWSRFIVQQREATWEKFIDANAPFWGSRDECARELKGTYVPICHQIARLGIAENVPAEMET